MLLRGSNNRGARSQTPNNRSRGSRGRGSTSRGASSSGTAPSPQPSNPFEQERLENAAKRVERGQNGVSSTARGGRGSRGAPRGAFNNRQVRFADAPAQDSDSSEEPSSTNTNPFATTSTAQFGAAQAPFNPFAASSTPSVNPFAPSGPSQNPFGAPTPATSTFGTSANPSPFNPFGSATNGSSNFPSGGNSIAPSSLITFGTASTKAPADAPSAFDFPGQSKQTHNSNAFFQPSTTGIAKQYPSAKSSFASAVAPGNSSSASSIGLAKKMDSILFRQGIKAPAWPATNPGDPKQKEAVKSFWQTPLKGYRTKVREALMKAGLLDDPDKPKKLSEAIDFKGTCEDMCPEFEKFTRIVDHSVDSAEKEPSPDGSLWPSMPKMIKALARSAAGQDAPLPMDVRTPAALRRTLDYLLHEVLGEDGHLSVVHGFLWDRTRAIRRDFVFQSAMTPSELIDQIYCLERITRFHVIALHQMSNEGITADNFSEQQEVEQLGKSLLSLIHAYEDCNAQSIECENEAEFRAYYVLFNSHNSGILETVQDWGWKFWGESDDIKTAVCLVETLQNTWDTRGPLKPHAETDVALNAYCKFLSIVADKKVSYTMACFAEIHFNSVRKSILKTILTSYRKQRDQTKDWTLNKLNTYLRFDDEEDILAFGEAYGLRFEIIDDEECLCFDSDNVTDPFPPLKQPHSYDLVERKRGGHPLPAVIDATVYDEESERDEEGCAEIREVTDDGEDEEDSLFVKDNLPVSQQPFQPVQSFHPFPQSIPPAAEAKIEQSKSADTATTSAETQAAPSQNPQKSLSVFDIGGNRKNFGSDFFKLPPSGQSTLEPSTTQLDPVAEFLKQQAKSTSATPPAASLFTFTPQPAAPLITPPSQSPLSLGDYAVTKEPVSAPPPALGLSGSSPFAPPIESPKQTSSLDGNPVTAQPSPSVTTAPTSSLSSQSPLPRPFFGTTPATTPASGSPTISSSRPSDQTSESAKQSINKTNEVFQTSSSLGVYDPGKADQKKRIAGFANWVFLGDDGFLDQFALFRVEEILKQTYASFKANEARRIAKEAEDIANKAADQYRWQFLAAKYANRWRTAAHRIWLKRRGREVRQLKRENAEIFRASKASKSANIVEDFKASTNSHRRRESLGSLLDATGVLDGVRNRKSHVKTIVQNGNLEKSGKSQRSRLSTPSPQSKAAKQKHGNSDDPLRRSIFSDPSYLTGGSRIHLMPNYSAEEETRHQVSGVQTDYFRLKARGITTLPNGTPLASSVARNILHRKHSFDGVSKLKSTTRTKSQSLARSVPSKPMHLSIPRKSSTERSDDIEAIKAKAQAIMAEDKRSKQKRSFESSDEELFERAKRVREQMDEGSEWYKREIERDTASLSRS